MKKRTSQKLRVCTEHLEKVHHAWKKQNFANHQAFVDQLGISRTPFSNFLNGKDVGRENFFKICEALKIDWQEIAGLLKDAENKPNEHQNKQANIETECAIFSTANAPANNAFTSEWWREVCRTMLENQKKQKLSTHPLNSCDKKLKDIYVPLGLVERSEIPRPALDISAEEGSKLYQEKITPISHQEFFEQVIKHGQSQKSKGRRIANIGEPGAGKTTLLQIIAFEALKNDELPIWVDLADLGKNESLKDYILLRWLEDALPIIHRHSPQIAPHQVSEELKKALSQEFCQGKVWLLLDGVDEMPAELGKPLTVISKQLKGWIAEARVVLSCRLNVWDADKNPLTDFDVYRNLDFSYPDEVREFIQKYFAEKPDKAKGLIAELEQSSKRIQDLIKNPLRLTLLCRTWELMEEKLPDTKAGIYQRLVEAHYQWKDDKQDFEISTDKQDKQRELNKELGELAKKAIDGTNSRFRLRESVVKHFLGEPNQEKSLFWWALKLGWLNPVGLATAEEKDSDEKVYAFFHPTFQEYFAALAIDDWNFFLNHNNENPNPFGQYKGKDCVYRIFEPQWKEVILLWLGRHDVESTQKDEFIEALINFKDKCDNFYHYKSFFLAAAGVAEFTSRLASQVLYKLFNLGLPSRPRLVEKHESQISVSWNFSLSNRLTAKARLAMRETDRNLFTEFLNDQLNLYKNIWNIDPHLLNTYSAGKIDKDSINEFHDIVREVRLLIAYILAKLQPIRQKEMANIIRKDIKNLLKELNLKQNQIVPENILQTKKSLFTSLYAYRLYEINPDDITAIQAIKVLSYSVVAQEVQLSHEEILKMSYLLNYLSSVINLSLINSTWQYGEDFLITKKYLNETNKPSQISFEKKLSALKLEKIMSDAPEQVTISVTDADKKRPLDIFIEMLKTNQDKRLLCGLVNRASEVGTGNLEIAKALMWLLSNNKDLDVREFTTQTLKAIITSSLFPQVVKELKISCLFAHQANDVDLYKRCDELLWYCADNMTYPEFYKAWNVEEIYTLNQSSNYAILPQDIRAAIEPELSQKIHPVCIDITEWIDINNPSLEIYDQMTDQGCLESPQNQPDTLQKLKLYFKNLNKTEKLYFLIFYKSNSEPQEIPQTLLTALSKFGPEIALITDQPLTNLNLKQFSPTLPITPIVGWMRKIVMET